MGLRCQVTEGLQAALSREFGGAEVVLSPQINDDRDDLSLGAFVEQVDVIVSAVMRAIDSLGCAALESVRNEIAVNGVYMGSGILTDGTSACAVLTMTFRNAMLRVSILWFPKY